MRHLGSRWNPSAAGTTSVEPTDSSTTPRNASDTDMAPLRSCERARWLMVSFSHKPDLLRDNGRNNKRRSTPRQVRFILQSNPGASAVLSCTWSTSTTRPCHRRPQCCRYTIGDIDGRSRASSQALHQQVLTSARTGHGPRWVPQLQGGMCGSMPLRRVTLPRLDSIRMTRPSLVHWSMRRSG